MNFKTYEELTDCMVRNLHKIPRDIDLIVGIPRSGTMVANILALYLNLPFTDINSFVNRSDLKSGTTRKCRTWIKSVDEARHVLVVDDSVSSGKAVREAKELLKEKNVTQQVTFLAVYVLTTSKRLVDIYFEICEQPRMFEWNYMHHWALEYCCIDMDGIICEDYQQLPYGNDRQESVADMSPKMLPTQKIGCLITDRPEKCKEEIISWLQKYAIDYENLALTNQKAEIYKKSKCILFFEYDCQQAAEICRYSGKPVFCVAERKLFTSDNVCENVKNRQREFFITTNRVVRKIFHKINYVK